MSNFIAVIQSVTTNGPYAYTILKDGVGIKAATNQANISAAMTAVQTDIGQNLAGETVGRVILNVHTT